MYMELYRFLLYLIGITDLSLSYVHGHISTHTEKRMWIEGRIYSKYVRPFYMYNKVQYERQPTIN